MAVDNTHFKGCWRPEEDEALRKAVAIHGEKNWSVVARHFNTLMGRPALLGRAPKQCRSRYLQQLVPGIKTGEWSPEEEEILVEGHKQFGNQWTLIASMLPGRTETSVKNHYNCTARRKVPSDLSRMTILQQYLASIGVISLHNTRGSKFPALGSGYPSSSSSQFFHHHGHTTAPHSGSKAGTHSAPISPAASHQYEEYDEEQQQQQQQQEYEQQLAYQQQQQQQAAVEYDEEHLQQQYAQYAACAFDQQPASVAEQGAEVEPAAGAADGLLQLARAALMHMEEEEEEEPAGSQAHKQEGADEADLQEDAAGQLQLQLQHTPQQLRQLRPSSSRLRAAAQQAGGSSLGGMWVKPELLPVVRSNSEDSDHTAEEEEGSPMAEANLKLQLQQALKPSSSLAGGKRSPAGHSSIAPGSSATKRHRPIWEQQGAPGSTTPPPAAAAPLRLHRPVLDVSEPAAYGAAAAAGISFGAAAGSKGSPVSSSPATARGGSPAGSLAASDAHAQLLALMMQAFMGAAAAEGTTPAAALSASHLAALARVMQLSGLAGSAATAAAAASSGSPSAGSIGGLGAGQAAVADVLGGMLQEAAASGAAAGAPVASWPTALEQHVRAAAGQ